MEKFFEMLSPSQNSAAAANFNLFFRPLPRQHLIQILRNPPKSFPVALPLQDRAHEKFQGPSMELRPRDLALAGCLAVESEDLPKVLFGGRPGPVNLVAQDEDGAVGQLLVCKEGVQLNLGLIETGAVAGVDQEHDRVHGGEVIFPHLTWVQEGN